MRKKRRQGYTYQVTDKVLYERKKSIPLFKMEASVRLANVLIINNINMIDDILRFSERDILQLRNCHKKSLEELTFLLREDYGVTSMPPVKLKNKCLFCGRPCCRKYCSRGHYLEHRKTKPRRADKRIPLILSMRKEGKSLQAIGNCFDLSRERVRQIIMGSMRIGVYDGKTTKKEQDSGG